MTNLPQGQEAVKFLNLWTAARGNPEQRERICQEYEIPYQRARYWAQEIRAQGKNTPDDELHVNLPPVDLREYKAPEKNGDEEVAILHASDGHGGKITRSFNDDVYRARMWKMFESAMTIINLHRNMYPIRKLYILNTGDNSQGENPYQGSAIGEVSMGARDQIKKLVAPMWVNVIGSFKQEFEEVQFDGWAGNHGYEKGAPETSRSDLLLYDVLEASIGQHNGIKVNVHDEWGSVIEIQGFRLFCFHGDGMPAPAGVPFFALDKKLKSWYMQFGGFQYSFSGHFHKQAANEVSNKLEHFMCASLVSDDDWALKKLGISSSPSQSLYGLHPKHGITWRYNLTVDDNFLPEKCRI
jgi:hypothetical protein